MSDASFLSWPFFDDRHRRLAADLEKWCDEWIHDAHPAGSLSVEQGEGGMFAA